MRALVMSAPIAKVLQEGDAREHNSHRSTIRGTGFMRDVQMNNAHFTY
jgi:hypothetical protein